MPLDINTLSTRLLETEFPQGFCQIKHVTFTAEGIHLNALAVEKKNC